MSSTEDTVVNNAEENPKEDETKKEKPIPSGKYGREGQPKRSKKEERQHKKEDRATEQFIKSLDSIASADDKLAALTKKFSEVSDENRRLQAYITQSNKRMAVVFKEKEGLQLEYNRTVLLKSKLENLCRELQKQNKTIKEESLLRIREEEEKRKETQAKFQTALTEITTLLQQNNDKNTKLREDNISMSTKFKSVVEKYELREQQVEKLGKQMDLENQLAEAKLSKSRLEAQAERERLNAEIAQLKLQIGQYQARMIESKNLEESLKGQLNIYTDKYDEFQNALVKSNQVFGGFKGEIEKMSKKITKLEKECATWKKRCETSQVALLEMATDKKMRDDHSALCERQLAQLQKLCRTMQGERTLLLTTLKEHDVECPPLSMVPPAPLAPIPQLSQPSKVDAMASNCAQLKQSLAQLQNQLNDLTTKKEEENRAKTEQPTKAKKNKSKKNKDKVQQESPPSQDSSDKKETSENIAQKEAEKENVVLEGSTDDDKVKTVESSNETSISDANVDLGKIESDTVSVESTETKLENDEINPKVDAVITNGCNPTEKCADSESIAQEKTKIEMNTEKSNDSQTEVVEKTLEITESNLQMVETKEADVAS